MIKSTLRQYLASGACAFSVTVVAICFFWLEPLMSWLVSQESEIQGLTTSDTSWLVASVEFGEVVFTIPAGLLADRFGRKPMILLVGPLALLSWVFVATIKSLWALYLVRFIHGIAVALVYTVAPIYIAEIAEPRIRGELSGHFMTYWFLGSLYVYCVGPYVSYQNYTYLCAIPPILFTFVFVMLPETPFYLVMANKKDKAEKSLKWLRCSEDVSTEFKTISDSVEADMKNKGSWRDLIATRKDIKALMIVQLVCAIKYLNGMPAVMCYATETFKQGTSINPHILSIGLGAVLCISSFITAFVSDSFGRRPLLLISILGSAIFNVITAVYYYLVGASEDDSVKDYYWLMFISILGFVIAANIGLGPLLQTMQAEYFPSNTRGRAGGVTELVASITTFLNLKQYQVISDNYGIYFNYVIFAAVGAVGFIVLYFTVEETAGTTLGEIQKGSKKDEKESCQYNDTHI